MSIARPPSSLRKAFTLVELLVTIAIIGVLIGLLIPAVQSARETARRMQCANHLRQIGMASHNFESTYQRLPSGLSGKSPPAKRTWLFDLLPYMENSNLYEQGLGEYEIEASPFLHQSFYALVASYQCPSDPASGSVQWTSGDFDQRLVAISNYLGVNGLNGREHSGVIYYDSETRFRAITDGLSNTLLAGERPPSNDF